MKNLFVLNGSTLNRGCEAILLSTYDILKGAFRDATFINSSFRDDRVASMPYLKLDGLRHLTHPTLSSLNGVGWQIRKRIFRRKFYFERYLDWADNVISLGGDNYSEEYGSADQYLDANERILASGKKLIIWGASIGPFQLDSALERRAAKQLRSVYQIVVRESKTRSYLSSLGITSNVTEMPDPAFALAAKEIKLAPHLERALQNGMIGLNLSPLIGKYRQDSDAWFQDSVNIVKGLLSEVRLPILLIPHVMISGNCDAAFHAAIAADIGDPERLFQLNGKELSSRELKHVISRLRCFVGARTHATIAGLSSCVPTLSIGYSVKAHGINTDLFGHTKWVVDQNLLTAEILANRVSELLNSESLVRDQLRERLKTYKSRTEVVRAIFQ